MKEFIETLKKHGYTAVSDQVGGWWVGTRWSQDFIAVREGRLKPPPSYHLMAEGESPELAFWCLDEIERRGWHPGLMPTEDKYVVFPLKKDGHAVMLRAVDNRTRACMNALVAVLEAK